MYYESYTFVIIAILTLIVVHAILMKYMIITTIILITIIVIVIPRTLYAVCYIVDLSINRWD